MRKSAIQINYNHMRILQIIGFCITSYCIFSIPTSAYTLVFFILICSKLALTLLKPVALTLEHYNEKFYITYSTHTEQITITQTFLSKHFYLVIYKTNIRPYKEFIAIFSPRHNCINAHLNSNIISK